MTAARRRDEVEVRRLAEASAWRVRLTEAGLTTMPELEAWLNDDPANSVAWRQVNTAWDAVGEMATAPEWMAARRDAIHRARRHARSRWTGTPMLAAAMTAAILIAAAALTTTNMLAPADYQTSLSERRVITLSDGSKVSLDSGTEVKVRYIANARQLELIRGQARFDVAHDTTRPFSVQAGDQTVIATGTAFNIDLLGPRVLVTLIQGRVTVLEGTRAPRLLALPMATPARPTASVVLAAGEQLVVAPDSAPRVEAASVERATAWENGQLVFDDEPLSSVAERVSRYTSHPIIVEPSVASLQISGVFNTGDANTFIDTVTHYLPVEEESQADGSIELKRRH